MENLSFDLATKARVPSIKRQNRSVVQENKKIPVKMLKKNVKIEKWMKIVLDFICVFILVMLFFWKTFANTHDQYVLLFLSYHFQNIDLKFLFIYLWTILLIAELYQHHNHASYIKGSVLYLYFVLKDFSLSAFVYISMLSINYS